MPIATSIVRIIVLILALGGCTIVNIDGPARVTMVGLGALKIEPTTSHGVVYRARGFGLVPGIGGATLGYRSETVALLPASPDCRLILFEPRRADALAIREILEPVVESKDICTNGGEKR